MSFHVFSSHFKSPVFLLYSLLTANFILLRLLFLSTQMISWKPLTPKKLQFSLLWICPPAFDTLHHITLLHKISAYFRFIWLCISWIRSYLTDRSSFVKLIRHPHLPPPYSQACLRALFSVHYLVYFSSFHITNCKCHKF